MQKVKYWFTVIDNYLNVGRCSEIIILINCYYLEKYITEYFYMLLFLKTINHIVQITDSFKKIKNLLISY